MSGNVWEWCKDWYGAYSSNGSQLQDNPIGAVEGTYRVIRGGSWHNIAQFCRPTFRYYFTPSISLNELGFRLCINPL